MEYQAGPFTRQEVRHAFEGPPTTLEHKLAIAAHNILEVEVGAARIDQVWNSEKPANIRACHSALWRAIWYARDEGLLTIAETTKEPTQ